MSSIFLQKYSVDIRVQFLDLNDVWSESFWPLSTLSRRHYILHVVLLAACHAPTLWPIEWRVLPLVRCDWLLKIAHLHIWWGQPLIKRCTLLVMDFCKSLFQKEDKLLIYLLSTLSLFFLRCTCHPVLMFVLMFFNGE